MTDEEEIIKALEDCCISDIPPCTTCKYDEDAITCDKCMGELMKDVLDLINRQRDEIKQKDTEIDILIRKNETLKDEVLELKNEIERLTKILNTRCDKCPTTE